MSQPSLCGLKAFLDSGFPPIPEVQSAINIVNQRVAYMISRIQESVNKQWILFIHNAQSTVWKDVEFYPIENFLTQRLIRMDQLKKAPEFDGTNSIALDPNKAECREFKIKTMYILPSKGCVIQNCESDTFDRDRISEYIDIYESDLYLRELGKKITSIAYDEMCRFIKQLRISDAGNGVIKIGLLGNRMEPFVYLQCNDALCGKISVKIAHEYGGVKLWPTSTLEVNNNESF